MRCSHLQLLNVITLFLLYFFTCFKADAQENPLSDSVKNLVKQAAVHIDRPNGQDLAFQKLALAEELALKTGKPIDLLRVYRQKAYLFHHNQDVVNTQKYLKKTYALLKYCKDSLEKAQSFETFGIIEPDNDKKMAYFLEALRLFTKYGKPENLIDINFNLANRSKKNKNWAQAIKHIRMSLTAIEESGKQKERQRYLYVFLSQCYTALDDYENARHALSEVDSIQNRPNYKGDQLFELSYLMTAANLYYKQGLYKKAADLKNQALNLSDRMRAIEKARLSKGILTEHELSLKKEELRRSEMENVLKLIFIVLICSLLVLLIIFALYQKRNAKKIRAINSVLEKKNTDLEHVTKELEMALKTKTDFLNVMTHELFTPINGMAIITHNLKAETDKNSFNQSLELLEFSSNYLYRLLKNIVDTKTIENEENMVLNRDVVHLKSLIKKVAQTTKIFLKISTNTFRYFIDSKIPDPLLIDSVKVSQILINLLNNANKYTSNGTITLNVELKSETDARAQVLFKIIDTGIGIEPEFLERIFDKFQHGSEVIKETYGGSGIGLYVVKHFLSLHNSEIKVSSEKENGSTFSFSIWFDKLNKIAAKPNLVNEISAGKILLVDDNKINLIVTKKLLESEAFKCDIADNGFDALKILKTNKYDLILMDIMMPGMNGFETTNHIKKLQINTPVLALTAVDVTQNKEEFERTGFAATIAKPFKPEELFKIIDKIIKTTEND